MSNDKEYLESKRKQLNDIKGLELLLEFTSPKRLKNSLISSLFSYLMEIDSKHLIPNNFESVVEDHYLLLGFLDKLEKE